MHLPIIPSSGKFNLPVSYNSFTPYISHIFTLIDLKPRVCYCVMVKFLQKTAQGWRTAGTEATEYNSNSRRYELSYNASIFLPNVTPSSTYITYIHI